MLKLVRRLFYWTHQQHIENDLAEEIEFHRTMRQEQFRQVGLSSEAAAAGSYRALGNSSLARENARGVWIWPWLEHLLQDIRFAFRLLFRNPFFSATSIILAATTIGLACATFSILYSTVLRKLPVPNPEQLVLVSGVGERGREAPTASLFDALEKERRCIARIFGYRGTILQVGLGSAMRSIPVCGIRGDYFGTQGAIPQLGRFFDSGEDQAGAVVSDHLWRQDLGGAPDVIGRYITLGTTQVPIIGVARPEFRGMEPYVDWQIILSWNTFARAMGSSPAGQPLEVVARLRPDVTAKAYEAQLNTIWPDLLRTTIPPGLTLDAWRKSMGTRVRVDSASRGINYLFEIQPGIPRAIRLTFWLSVLIFAAGCLTLALLGVARGVRNQHQISIRLAIGGGRWRVLRPYGIENSLIAALGCIGGLLIATWWSSIGVHFLPAGNADWNARIDLRTVSLAIAMAFLMAMVGTLIASFLAANAPVNRLLQSGTSMSQPHVGLRVSMLVLQLAMSVLLVHYAVIYVGELSRLIQVPLGFDTKDLHLYSLNAKLPVRNLDKDYFLNLLEQIRRLPGVESASLTGTAPALSYLRDPSQPLKTDDQRESRGAGVCVFPGYFNTLRLPLLSGRDFTWGDGRISAIVTSTLAKRLYPDGDPLTHAIKIGRLKQPLQIIGVVGDVPYNGPRLGASSTVFLPCVDTTNPMPSNYVVHIAIRSKRTLAELGKEVQAQVDRLGVHYIYRMVDQEEYLAGSLQQERMLATVSGLFGGLIVLLTGVGLFAFCNYLLTLRTKELAIRASLGAGPVRIAAALLHETAKALAIGSIIGIALTFAGQRVLSGVMEKVNPPSASQIIAALLIIAAVTFGAVFLPIIRALRMSIVDALRVE